jgi:hypothetical protein
MLALPILDCHAPPVRIMALHALAYCPRLFDLEEVEEIRVADERVYAGRQLHAGLNQRVFAHPGKGDRQREGLRNPRRQAIIFVVNRDQSSVWTAAG